MGKALELELLCSKTVGKVSQLAEAYQQLRRNNAALKRRNKELREEIEKLKEDKRMQSEQIVKHKLSERASAGDSNTDVKLKINELVREIDRCIGLLSE